MWFLNSALNKVFDLLFIPFRPLNPWFGMAFISLLTGLLMLFIFRRTSNQAGIRQAKDKIKAHLLELRLFKDNMSVTMSAQGQILRTNLRYIGYSFKPMLVMIIPLLLILVQLNFWFGYEPLRVGQPAVLKVKLVPTTKPLDLQFGVEAPPQIMVETAPLRLEDQKEVDWRLRPIAPGSFVLTIKAGSQSFVKNVVAGEKPLQKISPLKVRPGFFDEVFNPGEKPLAAAGPVRSIEILHPAKRLSLFGLRVHWLVAYLALSIVFGFALKKPFKVEI